MDNLEYKNTPYVHLSDIQADNDAALAKLQQEEQQQMETKTIHEKLSDIQKQLKAPKSQYNSFGKYKYRNCEDILESVKPYLNGCTLQLSDEIKEIAGIPYVEANAIFSNGTTYIVVKAQAGISVNRKGMDIAQSFGASSSYARKYALAGLFLLDDTKDADSQDNSKANVEEVANAIKSDGEPF
jgi:hypothetical protein